MLGLVGTGLGLSGAFDVIATSSASASPAEVKAASDTAWGGTQLACWLAAPLFLVAQLGLVFKRGR